MPQPGELLGGHYRLLEPISSGGMGAVFKALDTHADRPVAIKCLLPGKTSPAHLARFEREASLQGNLAGHSGIVRVHDWGKDERGRPYFVMDLVEGQDLGDLFEAGLDPERVAALVEEIAETLAHCHSRGILHRDLKPSNVLVRTSDGQTLLTDFGLARADEEQQRLTKTGQFMGTPAYMAPEQFLDPRGVDERADVYSLGAILYHGLTRQQPFAERSIDHVLALVEEQPQTPRSIDVHVPTALEAICLKAMAKEKEDRYSTARQLAQELRRWRKGERVSAGSESLITWLRRGLLRRERTTTLLVSVAVALVLVGAVGGATYGLVVLPRQRADRVLTGWGRFEAESLGPFALGLGSGLAPSSAALASWRSQLTALPESELQQRALDSLAAQERLAKHLAGERVRVPPQVEGRPGPELLVDALVLRDRGDLSLARERLERARGLSTVDAEVAGVLRVAIWEGLLEGAGGEEAAEDFFRYLARLAEGDDPRELELARTQARQALERRLARLVERAPAVPPDETLADLARVRRVTDDPSLSLNDLRSAAAAKAAALEASAPAWAERLEKIQAEGSEAALLGALQPLAAVVAAPPEVPVGLVLQEVLSELVAVELARYEAAERGDAKTTQALRALRVEAAVVAVDPSQDAGPAFAKLVRYVLGFDSYAHHLDLPAILAQLRADPARSFFEAFLIKRVDPAELQRRIAARPRSRALRFLAATRAVQEANAKRDPDFDPTLYGDTLEAVLRDGEDDLRGDYLVRAWELVGWLAIRRLRKLSQPGRQEPLSRSQLVELAQDCGRRAARLGPLNPYTAADLVRYRVDAAAWLGRTRVEQLQYMASAWNEQLAWLERRRLEVMSGPDADTMDDRWDRERAFILVDRGEALGVLTGTAEVDRASTLVIEEARAAAWAHLPEEKELEFRLKGAAIHQNCDRLEAADAVLMTNVRPSDWENGNFARLAVDTALKRKDRAAARVRVRAALARLPQDTYLLAVARQLEGSQ